MTLYLIVIHNSHSSLFTKVLILLIPLRGICLYKTMTYVRFERFIKVIVSVSMRLVRANILCVSVSIRPKIFINKLVEAISYDAF